MSLKIKIPVIIAVMLLINGVVLFIYNQVYFLDSLATRISNYTGTPIDISMLRGSSAIYELIFFEVVVLIIFIIALSVIIFLMYAKPLMELNKKVTTYRNHGEIKETARRDEIGQLQNGFAVLSQNLHAEKQAQNRIIASISHDIRTPLTSVLGYTEKLIKKDLPEERRAQYLKIVHGSAGDIQNIVTEFDEYISGKLSREVNRQQFRITYIEEMLVEEYALCGTEIVIENLCGAQDVVNIDISKARRIFANLIGNSIKHNKHAEHLRLVVTLARAGDYYEFSVADNGVGVSPENFAYIFEPFYTTQNRTRISGLGLSICKDIAENHGGYITAENLRPQGFKISCRFPV